MKVPIWNMGQSPSGEHWKIVWNSKKQLLKKILPSSHMKENKKPAFIGPYKNPVMYESSNLEHGSISTWRTLENCLDRKKAVMEKSSDIIAHEIIQKKSFHWAL